MANCKSCYCNRFMLKEMLQEDGCLYLFEQEYNRFRDVCPCVECLVKIMCRERYNVCDDFHVFINAAKTFKT